MPKYKVYLSYKNASHDIGVSWEEDLQVWFNSVKFNTNTNTTNAPSAGAKGIQIAYQQLITHHYYYSCYHDAFVYLAGHD